MPSYNYPAESLQVQAHLLGLGLTPDRLMLTRADPVAGAVNQLAQAFPVNRAG